MLTRLIRIKSLLTSLQPESFEIIDETPQHADHYHSADAEPTHLKITLWSPFFEGKSAVQRHRMVYTLLKEEFAQGLHALTLVLER